MKSDRGRGRSSDQGGTAVCVRRRREGTEVGERTEWPERRRGEGAVVPTITAHESARVCWAVPEPTPGGGLALYVQPIRCDMAEAEAFAWESLCRWVGRMALTYYT